MSGATQPVDQAGMLRRSLFMGSHEGVAGWEEVNTNPIMEEIVDFIGPGIKQTQIVVNIPPKIQVILFFKKWYSPCFDNFRSS